MIKAKIKGDGVTVKLEGSSKVLISELGVIINSVRDELGDEAIKLALTMSIVGIESSKEKKAKK